MKNICVYEAEDTFSALSAKELLESNDIMCLIPNEHLTSIIPCYSLATGGIKVLVNEKDFESAKNILERFIKDFENNKNESEEVKDNGLGKCSVCGGNNLTLKTKERIGFSIFFFIFIGPTKPFKKYVRYCEDCGNESKTMKHPSQNN